MFSFFPPLTRRKLSSPVGVSGYCAERYASATGLTGSNVPSVAVSSAKMLSGAHEIIITSASNNATKRLVVFIVFLLVKKFLMFKLMKFFRHYSMAHFAKNRFEVKLWLFST